MFSTYPCEYIRTELPPTNIVDWNAGILTRDDLAISEPALSLFVKFLKMPSGIYERTSIKRGKYSRYSQADKDVIIKAFNVEKDWKSVTEAMSIKEATAITWIRNGGITKPKGGQSL